MADGLARVSRYAFMLELREAVRNKLEELANWQVGETLLWSKR